jgi:hypothetical protein
MLFYVMEDTHRRTDITREAQSLILQRVYSSTTPEEQRWIARIILRGPPLSFFSQISYITLYCRYDHISERNNGLFRLPSRRT